MTLKKHFKWNRYIYSKTFQSFLNTFCKIYFSLNEYFFCSFFFFLLSIYINEMQTYLLIVNNVEDEKEYSLKQKVQNIFKDEYFFFILKIVPDCVIVSYCYNQLKHFMEIILLSYNLFPVNIILLSYIQFLPPLVVQSS